MNALTPHQEDVIREAFAGDVYSARQAGAIWQRIHERMGVAGREESGTWLMWLETTAWVIQYRPDLIPEDSPLSKALATRGLECGRFERIGRAIVHVLKEELR